tara:strand:- start:17397 stop:17864 length:468 start_codon:yes stop_codon:yes gene_type:complete
MLIRARAAMFKSLVDAVGGVEAARAVIEASVGHDISIASISRMQNANAEPVWAWVVALEDAAGQAPFSKMRARQLGQQKASSAVISHLDALRESSEMVLALAGAERSDDPQVLARALKETQDVADLVNHFVATLSDQCSGRASQDAIRLNGRGRG